MASSLAAFVLSLHARFHQRYLDKAEKCESKAEEAADDRGRLPNFNSNEASPQTAAMRLHGIGTFRRAVARNVAASLPLHTVSKPVAVMRHWPGNFVRRQTAVVFYKCAHISSPLYSGPRRPTRVPQHKPCGEFRAS
jgi:hypothetical protein